MTIKPHIFSFALKAFIDDQRSSNNSFFPLLLNLFPWVIYHELDLSEDGHCLWKLRLLSYYIVEWNYIDNSNSILYASQQQPKKNLLLYVLNLFYSNIDSLYLFYLFLRTKILKEVLQIEKKNQIKVLNNIKILDYCSNAGITT